jgi:hypothetical protein
MAYPRLAVYPCFLRLELADLCASGTLGERHRARYAVILHDGRNLEPERKAIGAESDLLSLERHARGEGLLLRDATVEDGSRGRGLRLHGPECGL